MIHMKRRLIFSENEKKKKNRMLSATKFYLGL